MNNWETSPKKEFNRRRLERCYKLDYKDIQYKEECLKRVQCLKTEVKSYAKTKPEKKMKKRSPYWNFWKVVFAGWLIRYPIQILRGIGTVVIGLFLFGVLVTSPDVEYNNDNAREVISE